MKITIPYSTSETPFSAPLRVWCDSHFSTGVALSVVDVELQLTSFVCLNQSEEIFRFVKDGISSNNVIVVREEPSLESR